MRGRRVSEPAASLREVRDRSGGSGLGGLEEEGCERGERLHESVQRKVRAIIEGAAAGRVVGKR